MCCSSKKPIKSQPPSVVQQEPANPPKEEHKPPEEIAVNLMQSNIQTEEQKQKELFDKLSAFQKTKYQQLKQDSIDHQYNQNPIDQTRLSFLKNQLTSLSFPKDTILGPQFLLERNNKLKEKGQQFAQTLRETTEVISNLRTVKETPYNCYSYIGYIKDKGQYFIKCWNGVDVEKFQQHLINLGKGEQQKLDHFKKYHSFKIENIQYKEPQTLQKNIHIISLIEDYNLYTFASSNQISLEQKLSVAQSIIQIIYQTSQESNLKDSRIKYFSQKNRFISPSNILISDVQGNFKVKISDWQQNLKEFEDVLPEITDQSIGYKSCSDHPEDQTAYIKKLLILLFFQLNFASQESLGNLDGLQVITRYVDQNSLFNDSNFYLQPKFEEYIKGKINKHSLQKQEYQKIWNILKEKNLEEIKEEILLFENKEGIY